MTNADDYILSTLQCVVRYMIIRHASLCKYIKFFDYGNSVIFLVLLNIAILPVILLSFYLFGSSTFIILVGPFKEIKCPQVKNHIFIRAVQFR